jgi:hypothetical protein
LTGPLRQPCGRRAALGAEQPRGPQNQKKIDGPWGGWLVPRKPKKYQGWSDFCEIFIVCLNSPHRETPKNVTKKNREKIGFGFLIDFFVKPFRHDFFVKRFCSVFEIPSLSST